VTVERSYRDANV